MTMSIRVFLVDDHKLVRHAVRELLEQCDDVEVVGEAGTAEEALLGIARTRPNVAVIDMRLPDGNGIEVCREVRLHDPNIHCLILTSVADDETRFNAVMAGAGGYLLKQVKGTDVVDAVRRVATGQPLLA
jgi:DNA-binding NarL/FixJ family response regulator